MLTTTYNLPVSICPCCGKELDAASRDERDAVPKPGDMSVCLGCSTVMFFNADMTMREATEEELANMPDEVRIEVQRMRRAIQQVRHMGRMRKVK